MLIPPSWFPHEATRKQRSSRATDVRGTLLLGTASTVRCRVEKKSSIQRDQQGRDILCQWRMAVPADVIPLWDDQWWLPSILGEPADDTTSNDAARSPKSIDRATNKLGTQGFHMVYF